MARTTGFGATFVLATLFTIFVSFVAALGGAFVGTAGAGASVTTPTARSPGGAAMSWTLYIGGRVALAPGCRSNSGRMIAAWSTADTPMGPASERGARRATRHFTTSSGSVTNPRLVTPAAWMIASTCATVP